jgi:hypothetical protein
MQKPDESFTCHPVDVSAIYSSFRLVAVIPPGSPDHSLHHPSFDGVIDIIVIPGEKIAQYRRNFAREAASVVMTRLRCCTSTHPGELDRHRVPCGAEGMSGLTLRPIASKAPSPNRRSAAELNA